MKLQWQKGVTLLETILALAIGISMVMLGIRFYDQFQFQANEQKIAATVNQLFQALEGFYYANCRQALDANSNALSPGALDPIVTDAFGIPSSIAVSITNSILTPGFIASADWHPNNPLVDNTVTGNGYFAQFNRITVNSADPVMSVYACTGSTAPPSCNATGGAVLATSAAPFTPAAQSHVATWVVQVAVKLSPSLSNAQWTQIKNDLNATCISTASGGGVAACSANPAANGYLIWTRTPSAYNPNITSGYWTATPYVRQFNMQYTNDGMAALSGVKNETQDPTTLKTWYNPLNYLCGG